MASKLVVAFRNQVVGEYPLDREVIVIGRRPDCDICIENLAVSGRHARVFSAGGAAYVEDLGSTNGTWLNGERIGEHRLRDGDAFMVGKHEVRYVAEGQPVRPGFAETIVLGAGVATPLRQEASPEEAARAARAADVGKDTGESRVAADIGPACLRSCGHDAKELPLTKALTTLGRPGVQVAAISRRQNGDHLVHVESGGDRPRINGRPMVERSRKLDHGDFIEIAGVELEYRRG